MQLPQPVLSLIYRLRSAGFPTYAVGGCVRDALLGLEPHDWDLCTSASPDQMRAVFTGERIAETGLRHGTLTVLIDHVPYEITTFRTDGEYTDHRRPDSVTFVADVREDLARRDFTVNAMAYAPDTGLVDCFGGREDLSARLIRCVGDSEYRFREDALRILRALRFAAVYDFEIEENTARALRALKDTLTLVAAERIRTELLKLLCGPAAGRILRGFPEVFAVLIPALAPMIGYDQNNHHHSYDLWEHTVRALEGVPPEPDLRLAMLLHDTGKPRACVTDRRGESHFPGHQAISAEIAEEVTAALRCDAASAEHVCKLVRYHDFPIRKADGTPNLDRAFLLRQLHRFGEQDLRALFIIHAADRTATGYSPPEREAARLAERMAALDAVLADQPCFTLRDLAVNGNDLLALGLRGKAVGETLEALLEKVMDGALPNEREALLDSLSGDASSLNISQI